MPFLGKDWRSPGEAWVKTSEGWERKKILEYKTNHGQPRYSRNRSAFHEKNKRDSSNYENNAEYQFGNSNIDFISNTVMNDYPPHCQITLKNTKEVIGFNNIGEAIQKLDFRNAVHDIRRFNYICKLLHLLITQNLTTLSGRATQILFAVLEEVARQVASNQQNLHILHMLLNDLRRIIRMYYCWGRPLGSTLLWEQHLKTIERICQFASDIEIKEPIEDGSYRLSDMPAAILREILLRLSDYKDLMNSAQASDDMKFLMEEQHIWRELCKFHFTREQIGGFFEGPRKVQPLNSKMDWQMVFHELRRKHGLKEEYTESLFLCRQCRCLFWKSFGHPCVDLNRGLPSNMEYIDETSNNLVNTVPMYIPVPPQAFLSFFSL